MAVCGSDNVPVPTPPSSVDPSASIYGGVLLPSVAGSGNKAVVCSAEPLTPWPSVRRIGRVRYLRLHVSIAV